MLDLKKFQLLEEQKKNICEQYNKENEKWQKRAAIVNEIADNVRFIYRDYQMIFVLFNIIGDNIQIRAIDFDEYLINEFEVPLELFIQDDYIELCTEYLDKYFAIRKEQLDKIIKNNQ